MVSSDNTICFIKATLLKWFMKYCENNTWQYFFSNLISSQINEFKKMLTVNELFSPSESEALGPCNYFLIRFQSCSVFLPHQMLFHEYFQDFFLIFDSILASINYSFFFNSRYSLNLPFHFRSQFPWWRFVFNSNS